MSQQQNNDMQQHFYRISATDFGEIPGSPIVYWAPAQVLHGFCHYPKLGDIVTPKLGMRTGDNNRFLRSWSEVENRKTNFTVENKEDALTKKVKWVPYNKGGENRKWYGNREFVVNWENDGREIKELTISNYPQLDWGNLGWKICNEEDYFKESITWSDVTSGINTFRYSPKGTIFDGRGSSAFPAKKDADLLLAFLNSKPATYILDMINPTLVTNLGDLKKLPLANIDNVDVSKMIEITRQDWDGFEMSWDFSCPPLLHCGRDSVEISYHKLQADRHATTLEMQRLEEENNRLFIDAYGLQDELTPEVPLSEITLTCNPHYRYGGNLADEEREARLQSDTICELISYAIGCMMGRYSLDREGLVYAHAGNEGFKALVEEGAYATFAADEDGILPLSTDSWFEDDVATRLEGFVCTVWGKETLEENLQFIADSLCLAAIKPVKKGGETSRETLRRYLSTQFYKDHLKTYKKRPIYWLFSSGKEKAFECLVYLHRYNEATLPRMRTEYVTPLLGQMAGRIERLRLQQTEASTSDAKRIGKEIDSLTKQLSELRAFDDQLKHHADMRITLDLDDGVKVNYGKFGTLLSDVKAITGDKGE